MGKLLLWALGQTGLVVHKLPILTKVSFLFSPIVILPILTFVLTEAFDDVVMGDIGQTANLFWR